ncbi:MAG: ATP-binding cassette domain-containing protein [Burkholderiaceae bacterium]
MKKVISTSIPTELILHLLLSRGVIANPDEADRLIDEANNNPLMVPSAKIDFILKRLTGTRYRIHQTALTQFNRAYLPALIFVNGKWQIIREKDSKLFLTTLWPEEDTLLDGSNLPVGVVISIRENEVTRLGQTERVISNSHQLIANLLFSEKRWLFDISAATVVVNIFAVLTSLFAMQIYDRVVPTLAFNTLYALVTGVTVIYFMDWLLKISRAKILDRKSSYLDKKISDYIYDHILHVQLDKVPPSLGTLSAQVSGLDAARQFFSSTIIFILVDLPFAVLFIVVVAVIGGPIAVVYGVTFVISLVFAYFMQKKSQKMVKTFISRSNERTGMLVDSIRGNETIRSTGAAQHFLREWNAINHTISISGLQQKSLTNLGGVSSALFGSLSYVIAMIVGVHLISTGQLTMGALVASSILGGRILGPISQAVSYMIQYENVKQGIDMVDKLLELPRERAKQQALLSPDTSPSGLSMESLKFQYDKCSTPQLQVGSLQFSPGERVSLLGAIGSGKSTMLKVAAGLYKPTDGRIRLGFFDMWELDPFYISNNVCYLPQSVDLFKGTLKSNLCMDNDVSEVKLMHVMNLLGLDVIAQNSGKGLDMLIHEGGGGLSGGQRQLVGLGRIMLKQPTIWLLDEPTASLDSHAQKRVISAIQSLIRPSDILIFATHNPQLALELGTRMIIMENGMVIKDVPTSSVEVRRRSA